MLRVLMLLGAFLTIVGAADQSPASKLWNELKEKRETLPGVHQEFEVTRIYTFVSSTQSIKRQAILDMSQSVWRERSVGGLGNRTTVFDGKNLLSIEDGDSEYTRAKHRPKDENPLPPPYKIDDPDWPKATVVTRLPCGWKGGDHVCVVLEVPLKKSVRAASPNHVMWRSEGYARMSIDTGTGLIMSARMMQIIHSRRSSYKADTLYALKRLTCDAAVDASLFKLPSEGLREVRQLSSWNASKIRKLLAGKPAPELNVTDIQGKPVTLAAYKGKTVLLDFFTTWCPPCRADGPSLDKLYKKYGERDLMIVGISLGEERAIVEKFLKERPHLYPIVLSAENEMARPYQIALLPTYIVIDGNGNVAAAVEGDQGFGQLRRLLKKAGMDVD